MVNFVDAWNESNDDDCQDRIQSELDNNLDWDSILAASENMSNGGSPTNAYPSIVRFDRKSHIITIEVEVSWTELVPSNCKDLSSKFGFDSKYRLKISNEGQDYDVASCGNTSPSMGTKGDYY